MSKQRKRNFPLLKVILAFLVLSLVLVGCAGVTAPPSASSTAGEAAVEEAEPMEQEPMVILTTGELVSLDPMYTQSDAVLNQNLFQTLLFFNDQGELVPQVAESYEALDELTWEIKLKKGYTFWNGKPVDADAVVFTFERGQRLFEAGEGDVTFGFNSLDMASIEKIDDYTVHFTTNKPIPITPVHLAYIETSLLEPEYYTEHDPEYTGRNPMGSGPYQFVEYVPGERVVLEAYEDYLDGPAEIKNVIVRPVPELATRVNELKAGNADVISNVTPDLFPEIEATDGTGIVTTVGMRRVFVSIKQPRHIAQADAKVRQAMNYAVNKEAIIESLFGGYARASADIINPPRQNPDLWSYPYDPEKAAELLDEAGWVLGDDGVRVKDGERLSLEFDSPNGRILFDKEMAQIIASDLEKVGVEIADFRVLEWSIVSDMRRNQGEGYRDLMFMASGADYECADDLLLVQADSGSNRASWNEPVFEEKYAMLEETYDPVERLKLCWELEQYAVEQAPQIFIYIQPNFWGVSDRINWNGRPDNRDWWYNASYNE